MIIAIDLRSIQKGNFSGVENYTLSCVEPLIREDRQNRYLLFYNGAKVEPRPELRFLNANNVVRRVPNKLLALSIRLFNKPDFANFLGDFDTLFLPNINHIALNPTKKLVVTVHDLSPLRMPENFDLKRKLWHWSVGFKKTLQRANRIIAVSNFTKSDLVNLLGLPPEKISVVYQGVDHQKFKPELDVIRMREVRNRYGLPGEFILFLATLEPRKNLLRLLEAWENMRLDIPLVIAGKPGWKYTKIFEAAKQSHKKNRLQFLGFVVEQDKPYLMKLARVFTFPSLYEGFGLPILESMAVGTPVVTSSSTSLPEVAGDAGLLVNPYNTDELTFALEQAVEDENLRKIMIEKGLSQAQQFSWSKTAEETLKILTG